MQYQCIVKLGPFSIEATKAVAVDIILTFLVYLANNISLRQYIQKKTNLDFFFIFPRKGYLCGWRLYVWSKYSYLYRNVFTFGGAKGSGSDRECKYFPIGLNACEPLWR